jgi:hypothetical protein
MINQELSYTQQPMINQELSYTQQPMINQEPSYTPQPINNNFTNKMLINNNCNKKKYDNNILGSNDCLFSKKKINNHKCNFSHIM